MILTPHKMQEIVGFVSQNSIDGYTKRAQGYIKILLTALCDEKAENITYLETAQFSATRGKVNGQQ